MTQSDKQIIAIALAPIAIYFAIAVTVFALNPSHFPGAMFGAAGGVVAPASVAFANVLRMRRQRKG